MMARGEPGVPRRFRWRGRSFQVTGILGTWKVTGEDRGDVYVRRHGHRVQTACGLVMRLSGERAVRGRAPRWYLRSIEGHADPS